MADQTATAPAPTARSLRRDVPVWGSFMWGFADVGAEALLGKAVPTR
ncbi:MAG TPA: hypothetical protein VEW91_02235 [bacterium]|nr:hypothetical protein [bacterium]